MDIFRNKLASEALVDVNHGASSLQYHECMPKSQPSSFDTSTMLTFEFSGATDRYTILSESYFEVKYICGRVAQQGAAAPVAQVLGALPASVYKGTGEAQADAAAIAVSLQPQFLNHCISSVRHSINSVLVESSNEPATAAAILAQDRSYSFDATAASAYRINMAENRAITATGVEQSCAYKPPLSLFSSCKTPIAGCQHTIVLDLGTHASYNASVWHVSNAADGSAPAKIAADFATTTAQALAGVVNNRELYCFGIKEITLHVCTVQPANMAIPGPSLLLETTNNIEVHRLDSPASRQIHKQVLMSGSTYRVDTFFSGAEPNGVNDSIAHPLNKITTNLQSMSLSVNGQQQYLPQLESLMSGPNPLRPYMNYLGALGALSSDAESCVKTQSEFSVEPVYISRVVQPATVAPKEVQLKCAFQHNAPRTVCVCGHSTTAVALFYDASGHVSSVAVNG